MKFYIKTKTTNFNKKNSLKKEFFLNTLFGILLKLVVMVYTVIRIVLFDFYLGISHLGVLTIMSSIVPFFLVFITGSQSKSLYVFYDDVVKKNYEGLNLKIQYQIKEMKQNGYLSILLILIFLPFAFFFLKSPGMPSWINPLLVLTTAAEYLSFAFVVPFVQWYLNAIYKNYIFDAWSVFFSTIFNLVSFVIIILFGKNVIIFNNHIVGSYIIIIIVSCMISLRFLASNLVLDFQKKKYMPWFKVIKNKKITLFKKPLSSYIVQSIISLIACSLTPFLLFTLTNFYQSMTIIGGIYFSYFTFSNAISIITFFIYSLRPLLIKLNNNISNPSHYRKMILSLNGGISLFLFFNYLFWMPFLSIFIGSYFSPLLTIVIAISTFLTVLKSVEENYIYLDGKPEKYNYLTLIEIGSQVLFLILLLTIFLTVNKEIVTSIDLLALIIGCEAIARFVKYLLNFMYIKKFINKTYFLQNKRNIFLIFIVFIIVSMLYILFWYVSPYGINLNTICQPTKIYLNSTVFHSTVLKLQDIDWIAVVFSWLIISSFLLVFLYEVFGRNFIDIKRLFNIKVSN